MYIASMKLAAGIVLAALALAGCSSHKWADAAKAMAEEVCKCTDWKCGDTAFRKFLADMGAHKEDVGMGELEDIGNAEHKADACLAKLK
jgi:hypothetical protein